MRTLIDKINHFEQLPKQTVEEFNKLFTNCPLCGIIAPDAEVTIGEIADTETTRFITVGDKLIIKHQFAFEREMIPEYDNSRDEIPARHREKIHGMNKMW